VSPPERDDPDRDAILTRRRFMVSVALGGLAVGCAHGEGSEFHPCLQPEYRIDRERAPEVLTFSPGSGELDADGRAQLDQLLARLETLVDVEQIILHPPSADWAEEMSPVAHRRTETVMLALEQAGFSATIERSPQDDGEVPADTILVSLIRRVF
jgi:hypothetical protein